MRLVGQVAGRIVLMIDDIADTCGTLVQAATLLKENGAIRTIAYASHGVLSGKAFETLAKAEKDLDFKLVVSDTINVMANAQRKGGCPNNLEIISFSEMTALAIQIANTGGSLSLLYDYDTWLSSLAVFDQDDSLPDKEIAAKESRKRKQDGEASSDKKAKQSV